MHPSGARFVDRPVVFLAVLSDLSSIQPSKQIFRGQIGYVSLEHELKRNSQLAKLLFNRLPAILVTNLYVHNKNLRDVKCFHHVFSPGRLRNLMKFAATT